MFLGLFSKLNQNQQGVILTLTLVSLRRMIDQPLFVPNVSLNNLLTFLKSLEIIFGIFP